MKTLIAASLVALAWSAGGNAAQAVPVDDDPPISCPFCGGGMQTHQAIIGRAAQIQSAAYLRLFVATRD